MIEHTCDHCGWPLGYHGTQKNIVRGTEFDQLHCDNPDCPQYTVTRAYNERPMDAQERDRLLQKCFGERWQD